MGDCLDSNDEHKTAFLYLKRRSFADRNDVIDQTLVLVLGPDHAAAACLPVHYSNIKLYGVSI